MKKVFLAVAIAAVLISAVLLWNVSKSQTFQFFGKPGSIILLHVMFDSRKESIAAIKGIVHGLEQEGYSFKTVSELLKY